MSETSSDKEKAATDELQHRRNRRPLWLAAIISAVYAAFAGYQAYLIRGTNQQSKEFFETTQRPYVSLGRKDGTLAEFVEPTDTRLGERVGLKIYLQNGGQSAALTPSIGIIMGIVIGYANGKWDIPYALTIVQPFQHLLRYRDVKGSGGGSNGNGSIPPQSEYIAWVHDLLTPEELNSMRVGRKTLELTGELEYCDEFGRYSCRNFTIVFNGPPINAFSEADESDCAIMYRYPPRRPDQVYLPPCEQPSERDAREKQERAEITKSIKAAPLIAPTASPTPKQ